ncbi:GAF domain-containing protein [Hymenobacter sp. 5317J-9]|uniref:GAF domain-containing protein n=1 Tax=Hymenobacter sp. 5317J-9 TaxID=2932250 RepID=UPI001FD70C3E|nr:GAF domain-containing protein [Hymenobacter sp. 5317J-9]UOQ99653.1 GAF domain-containing protein [Hymenobacter sp. 5317J-9]
MESSIFPGLIPSYEHQRLAALQPYHVLGTPGQALFNDFVGVVAKLFDMPIALVSLVRAADVVFIGNAGLPEALVVDREDSMCSVAILNDDITEFRDIAAEPCNLVNPYVVQQLQLGFYAGQALRAPDGLAVGTLCVIDRRPRELSAVEQELLKELSLVAQELLSLQAAQAADPALVPALRARIDGPLQESLTRLNTLAELRQWEASADTEEARRYNDSRLEEARYLARTLFRELQAVPRQ